MTAPHGASAARRTRDNVRTPQGAASPLLGTIPSGRYSSGMSPRPSKRQTLLRHAAQLVSEQGYSGLTLDAVGAASGVSKGGVLYHFPTKEALVAALVEDMVAAFEAGQLQAHAEDASTPGSWTRAYLRASGAGAVEGSEHRAMVALLAAVGHDPSLLAPVQDRYRQWSQRLEGDDLPGVDAHVVRLAADGLWAADLFGLAPPHGRTRRRILGRLRELAGGAGGRT